MSLHFNSFVQSSFFFLVIINMNISLPTLHVKQHYIYTYDEIKLLSCPQPDYILVFIRHDYKMIM